ncbi:MAG TPA: dihydroneopterin aldolase [Candidatus Paceibacterota bacterium]|nr:dihydroneopterin aldolase [Candidatus Paceibacterota bacterium]
MPQIATLFIRDLIFSGRHGKTGRETHDKQRFKININLNLDVEDAVKTDNLTDTYDYKHACQIAQSVIAEEQHILIEKIAARISQKICQSPKIISAEVTLEKLDARDNGIPGISFRLKRNPQEMTEYLLDFDLEKVLEELDKVGGVSIPILSESYRKNLLAEAETYKYNKQPEIVGPAKVHEQLSSTYDFKPDSLFFRLKADFEDLLNRKIKELITYPFERELDFNEMSLQLYEKGSIGITPHMDSKRAINLICIFILTGQAKLAICDDREGNNPRFLETTPGNLILLRGPGLFNSDSRPFHFVSEVTERRIIFGMRQKLSA